MISKKINFLIFFLMITVVIVSLLSYIKLVPEASLKPTSEIIPIPEVEILSHHLCKDSLGLYHIIGEVRNTGLNNLIVEIVAYLYGKGSVAGFGWGFTAIPILVPNQKSPFRIILKPAQENIEHYMLKLKFGTTMQQPYRGLRVLTHCFYINDRGHFHVIGKIKNVGDQDVAHVKVIGTFYDVTGAVIAVNSIYVDSQNFTAGQEAWFELVIPDKALSYRISDYSLDAWTPSGLYIVSPKW